MSFSKIFYTHYHILRANNTQQALMPPIMYGGILRLGRLSEMAEQLKDFLYRKTNPDTLRQRMPALLHQYLYDYTYTLSLTPKEQQPKGFHPFITAFFLNDPQLFEHAQHCGFSLKDPWDTHLFERVHILLSIPKKEGSKTLKDQDILPLLQAHLRTQTDESVSKYLMQDLHRLTDGAPNIGHFLSLCCTQLPSTFLPLSALHSLAHQLLLQQQLSESTQASPSAQKPTHTAPKRL